MRRKRPVHRRDWRRLWRYCRCGYRWRCPDSYWLVPAPWPPPHLRTSEVTPDEPPPPRSRPLNRGPQYRPASGAVVSTTGIKVIRATPPRRQAS